MREALATARRRLSAAHIEDANLEAEILLRHALSIPIAGVHGRAPLPTAEIVSRAQLYTRLSDPLDHQVAATFEGYLERRLAHEPTAYITCRREFWGLDLAVTPAVLIPRPETETLVDAAVELLRRRPPGSARNWPDTSFDSSEESSAPIHRPAPDFPAPPAGTGVSIADIGTGSGAIALALAKSLPGARIIAVDSSAGALAIAEANARRNGLAGRIDFRRGDFLEPLDTPVDVIVANLPYVTTADYFNLPPEIREHEPRAALDGGPDGLEIIRRLLGDAPRHVTSAGAICLEFGTGQEAALVAFANSAVPGAKFSVVSDLAAHPRVLVINLGHAGDP